MGKTSPRFFLTHSDLLASPQPPQDPSRKWNTDSRNTIVQNATLQKQQLDKTPLYVVGGLNSLTEYNHSNLTIEPLTIENPVVPVVEKSSSTTIIEKQQVNNSNNPDVKAALSALDWVGSVPDADPIVIVSIAKFLLRNPGAARKPAGFLRALLEQSDRGLGYAVEKGLLTGRVAATLQEPLGELPSPAGVQPMSYEDWAEAECENPTWAAAVRTEARRRADAQAIGAKGFMLLLRTVAATWDPPVGPNTQAVGENPF